MKKQALSLLAVATIAYNTAVLVKNLRQARANPTLANVVGLIGASSVLIGSLRSR